MFDFVATGYNINYSSFDLAPDSMYETMIAAHIAVYWLIDSLLVLHASAAIKHHLIDKDDVLVRMLPFTRARDDG